MWAVTNETPYAAERSWARDKSGVHLWLVAVQATFDIARDGPLNLSDEQPPPPILPEHRGDPATTSLRSDSDLLAPKPATDILLDACAHAPGGRPASSVLVTLRVGGEIDKTLTVHGPRVYRGSGSPPSVSSSQPFVLQPIVYEAAFGGADLSDPDPRRHRMDPRNPVGLGVAADTRRLANQPAHTIEYPDGSTSRGPAGYGPIERSWSPRRELAGTYDAKWSSTKRPLLPDDYDDRFALSSPPDQRVAAPLRGGETVQLVNMTPESTLRFELPKIAVRFTTRFGTREEEHAGSLSTVFIQPEKMRLTMTWQTALRVPARQVEQLDETTVTEKRYLR